MIAAAIENDHAIGVAEHDVHVVLGEQHRECCSRASEAASSINSAARTRRHARRRLVHQQQPRPAGQRQRELDPLRIAIGERRAMPWSAKRVMPTRSSSGVGLVAREIDGARTSSPPCALSRASSAICTFSRTVIDANVAATWNVRPTPRRAMARGGSPSMRSPSKATCRHPARAGR